MPFNVWLLMLAQSFAMSATPIMVLLGGLIGAKIAPSNALATLPIAMMVVGVAVAVMPVSRMMRAFGRKKIFIGGALTAALAGLLGAYSTAIEHFWLFCISATLLGSAGAVVQQYRFAAMESVAPELGAKAASRVLLGGLVAAVLGPELAVAGSAWFDILYVGAFILLTAVSLLAAITLSFYRESVALEASVLGEGVKRERRLRDILASHQIWVAVMGATIGYALMSFVMTATPLHMHHIEHHSLADTKWVIQSHIIAMYLPSLFSGYLVARLGVAKMMLLGLFAYLLTIIMALMGHELLNYWLALVLLGIGWNFLFVAGTALLPRCYLPHERFKVQAFNDSFVFSSQAIASLSAGWVIHSLGWQSLLLICVPLILVQMALLISWKFNKSSRLQSSNP